MDWTSFDVTEWIFSRIGALDGTYTNAEASSPFPLGTFTGPPICNSNLLITGLVDGPLPGGFPKLVEIKATSAIPDLSQYVF